MQLRSSIRTTGGHVVLALDGVADLAATPMLHDVLSRFVGDHPARSLVVDLDGVVVLDDTALGLLLGAAADARRLGGAMWVVVRDERLRRRFADTRFDRAVEVAPSIAECRAVAIDSNEPTER